MTKQILIALSFFMLITAASGRDDDNKSSIKDIRINDFTNTLSIDDINIIQQKLGDFHKETGSQISVRFISKLPKGHSLESISMELAHDSLQIGREGIDDGVFILVVKDDRLVRIEVGYGLEGAIPDILAKRIIDEYIVPNFRAGDFKSGITAALDALMILIRGENLPPPTAPVLVDEYEDMA